MSVSRDANGFTVATPTAGVSNVYYVSSAGSDSNNGTSPTSPFATIAKARSLLRNNQPDYVLLRRGDTFATPISGWTLSGKSATEPMVIGAYTDPNKPSLDRPKITTGTASGFANAATSSSHPTISHLYIMGVAFEADSRNYRSPVAGKFTTNFTSDAAGGTYGINLLGGASDFLVEDCSFQYFRTGVAAQSISGWGNPVDFRLRRSVVADSYAPNYDSSGNYITSEGIYADGVTNLTLDGNVFDHNGWTDAAYSSLGCNPSIYNHDAYLNVHNDNVVVTGNVFANAASHGLQARAGGVVDNNLFLNDPIAMSYGLVNGEVKAGGVTGEVAGNTIVGSRNIDANNPRGWGLEIGNTKSVANGGGVVVKNNVYTTYAGSGQPAIQVTVGSNAVNPTQEVGINDLTIQNNVVYGWTKGITTNGGLVDGATGRTGVNGLIVRNNDFQQTLLTPVVEHNNSYSASGESWSNNRYNSVKTDTGSQQYFKLGSTYTYLSGWKSGIEPTATEVKVSYPDPSRTAATYDKSLGGTGTDDSFMAQERRQSSTFWRSQYSASAVTDYVKAGFLGARIDSGAPPRPPRRPR